MNTSTHESLSTASKVVVLWAEEGGTTRLFVTIDPEFAEASLADMGFTVHRRPDLAEVLARFGGTAVLGRVK